jgi:MFS family permease
MAIDASVGRDQLVQGENNGIVKKKTKFVTTTVLVGALGYFVDIYDLLLFGIVRIASLKGIGVPESKLLEMGVKLINMQMAGMLVGGVLWGVLGDKRGRVSVLFGSILLYSVSNIANAFVNSVEAYGILRFLAGVGLAGELGAAITLVTETLSKDQRGMGATIVASVGILGAVVAGLVGDLFSWRVAYIIGGMMGLALLLARLSILESGMFESTKSKNVNRGQIQMLLYPWPRFMKYLRSILIGIPTWYIVGILITFSPELAQSLGVQGQVSAGKAILFCYLAASLGDLLSGYLSQILSSRRQVIFGFLVLTLGVVAIYLFSHGLSVTQFYTLCAALGFASGYWAVFLTVAAEQFGTNIRATVTTTAPNFVRGSVVLLTSLFQALRQPFGLVQSAWMVGLGCIIVALVATYLSEETFGKDLDYLED